MTANEVTLVRGTYRQITIQDIKIGGKTPDLTKFSVFAQVRDAVAESGDVLLDFAKHADQLQIVDAASVPKVEMVFTASMSRKLPAGKAYAGVKIQDRSNPEVVYQVALVRLDVSDTTTVIG